MRNLRPALLVLLISSLAGLGVPAGFGQTKAVPKTSKAKSGSSETAPSKTSGKKKATGSNAATKSNQPNSALSKRAPANTSNRPSTTSAKKGTSKSFKKSRKQPGQKVPTADRVIEIQSALAKDGSFQGSPNGKWDDNTSVAMRKFQSSHGLNPNGKLDAPTLQRLGLGSQTAGVAAPTPPPGSFSRLTSSNNAPSGVSDSPRRP